MCLTLRLKCILVVFILPQTNTDGFAFCSNCLEKASVPVPGTRGGRRCRPAGLCGTGGHKAGWKRNAPQRLVHSIWSDLKDGSPPHCHLLPRRIYLSGFCLSVPTGNLAHPVADYPDFFFFFPLAHRMFIALIPKLCTKSHSLRTSFFNNTRYLLRHYLQAWADRHFITYLQNDYGY